METALGLGCLGSSDIILSINALPEVGLEGAAGWVEDELGGEVGADRSGLLGRLGLFLGSKGDGRLVECEAVNFRIKVKGTWGRRGWGWGSWAASGLSRASGGGNWCNSLLLLLISCDIEEVVKSGAGTWGSVGILGTRSGSDAVLVLGLS